METVTSIDGTSIAFWRSGQGPALLLVHGAIADHTTTWRFVLPELEKYFTVYAMDRRGRGGSGDHRTYRLQREAQDVAAILRSIDGPVSVLGHSYGALCAIEASLLVGRLDRLILYEGVPLRGAEIFRPGVIDALEGQLARGDVEDMLLAMLRDVVELPPHDIDLLRQQPESWNTRLRNAPTIPRELRSEAEYVFAPERFSEMQTPTLLLVGEESHEREMRNAAGVARSLPQARVVTLPGQRHIAMYSAPELFADTVISFLAS
jgi:pimeloyl-ACP methyl ester carboxylesterase